MNRIFTLVLSSIILLLVAFRPLADLDNVISALKGGNATELAKYVDDNIEINLPDKSDTYSRTQALMILKDFFTNNDVKSFDVKHRGSSGNNQYCVGDLNTKSGVYRTTVLMINKNGKSLVKEITFKSS